MEEKLNKLTLAGGFIAYCVYGFLAIKCGGNVWGLLTFDLCFFVGILCCGDLLKSVLIKDETMFSHIALSFCLGVLFLYLNFIVTDRMGCKRAMIAVPLLLGACRLVRQWKSVSSISLFKGKKWALYLTFCLFAAAFTLCGMLPYARIDLTKNFFLHQDMMWSVSNAASVYNGFPVPDMRFAGTMLHYHYLNDVTAGMLAVVTGQAAYEVFCFYWYMAVAIVLIVAAYQSAGYFTDNELLKCIMPFAVLFCVGGTGASQYISNMNGQGSATLTLCGGLALLDHAENTVSQKTNKARFFLNCLAFTGVGFVITMFKSTIGALFLLANLAACVVGLFTKKTKWQNAVWTVCMAAGFAVAYIPILSHAVNNLVFSGLSGLRNILPQLFKHAVLGVGVYAICLFSILKNFKKLSFLELCVNAMFAGGVVAFLVFSHYSYSQVYFILIAIPVMWMCCCGSLGAAMKKSKFVTCALCGVILCTGVYNSLTLLPSARTGVQALLRIYDLRSSDYDEANMTADDYHAMVWLRDNTDQDRVFATNRNNKYFQQADGVFHYYTAVSQRQCYLESYRYTMDYSGDYWEVRRRLEQVSDRIFYDLPEKDAFETAAEEKIDYLVVFKKIDHPQWQREPVYENGTVTIYKV